MKTKPRKALVMIGKRSDLLRVIEELYEDGVTEFDTAAPVTEAGIGGEWFTTVRGSEAGLDMMQARLSGMRTENGYSDASANAARGCHLEMWRA